jgi:predicted Zn-dependent peptidase
MFVQSGIESENEMKSKEAILQQLDDIRNGNFSDEDISASIKSLEDSFKSVSDSPESLDSWFMSQCVSGKYKYPEDYIAGFKAVTREQIISAAKDVTLDTVFMLEGTLEGGEDDE